MKRGKLSLTLVLVSLYVFCLGLSSPSASMITQNFYWETSRLQTYFTNNGNDLDDVLVDAAAGNGWFNGFDNSLGTLTAVTMDYTVTNRGYADLGSDGRPTGELYYAHDASAYRYGASAISIGDFSGLTVVGVFENPRTNSIFELNYEPHMYDVDEFSLVWTAHSLDMAGLHDWSTDWTLLAGAEQHITPPIPEFMGTLTNYMVSSRWTYDIDLTYHYDTAEGGGPGQGQDPATVPEPTTMLLFGTGLAGVAGARLRRKKK